MSGTRNDTAPGPIGSHGLVGCVRGKLVHIGGPDGGDHILSTEAALELRDWITRNVASGARGPAMEAAVSIAEATFDPASRQPADARQIHIFDALEAGKDTMPPEWLELQAQQAKAWAQYADATIPVTESI